MPDSGFAVGGAFKFKGAKDAGIDKKRKKQKKKPASEAVVTPDEGDRTSAGKPEGSTRPQPQQAPTKTKAEADFERRRKERLLEDALRTGPKTHKDRVREFNEKLAQQSDHHDMPRIGPG